MNWIKNIFSKKHDKQCAIHVVSNSVCPNCGAKGHRTTLTNNSYACKKQNLVGKWLLTVGYMCCTPDH